MRVSTRLMVFHLVDVAQSQRVYPVSLRDAASIERKPPFESFDTTCVYWKFRINAWSQLKGTEPQQRPRWGIYDKSALNKCRELASRCQYLDTYIHAWACVSLRECRSKWKSWCIHAPIKAILVACWMTLPSKVLEVDQRRRRASPINRIRPKSWGTARIIDSCLSLGRE